jgi:hypothetical protein
MLLCYNLLSWQFLKQIVSTKKTQDDIIEYGPEENEKLP